MRNNGPTPHRTLGKIKSVAMAFLLALAMLVGIEGASPVQAGAQTGGQILPCPGSPIGVPGWFPTLNGSVNCSWTDNHIVVDVYGPNGVARKTAALEIFYSIAECSPSWYVDTSGYFSITLNNGRYSPGCFGKNPQGTYHSGTGILSQGPLLPCISRCGTEGVQLFHRSATGAGWGTRYANGGVTWLRDLGYYSLSYGPGYANVGWDANNAGTNSGSDYRRMGLTFRAAYATNQQ